MPTKQKDGYYRTKIRVGTGPDGRPIDKWIRAKTLRELDERKAEVRRTYVDGSVHPDTSVLFGAYAIEWYRTRREPFISEHAKMRYRAALNNHIFPALGDRRMTAIRRADLQAVLNTLEGRSRSFIGCVRGILSDVFGSAVGDGILQRDPSSGLISPAASEPKEKRLLSHEERAALESAAATRPWLAILYYTGMRTGEMRALRWQDIDLSSSLIRITRAAGIRAGEFTPGKTRASRRTVPIVPQLAAILREYSLVLPSTPVTGEYLSDHQMIYLWQCTLRELGLPADLTLHCLRHNFITLCWEKRMDVLTVSRIVGHTKSATTMDIYTHLDLASSRDIATELASAFQ